MPFMHRLNVKKAISHMIRWMVYPLVIVVPMVAAGIAGSWTTMDMMMGDINNRPFLESNLELQPPPYNPNKPTVAVMLGAKSTEILDALIPYEILSSTGALNVFVTAPTADITTLSGGLDILPHYSFEELDLLTNHHLDVLVVPAIFYTEHESYAAAEDFIRKHAANPETLILSVCAGAANLAGAGLLEGLTATTHFGDMVGLKRKYPNVNWIAGRRYVQDGNIITTAGITAGIDGSLFVVSTLVGEDAAKRASDAIGYPNYHFVSNPTMDPYQLSVQDAAIAVLNMGFSWKKHTAGIWLYDGVEESSLGSLFDTYTASGTTNTYTASDTATPIRTQYGLYVVPRYVASSPLRVDRMLVAGSNVSHDAQRSIMEWSERNNRPLVYLHATQPDRFFLEPVLEDLAALTNVPTAAFAAKRLEYRADGLQLEGTRSMLGVAVAPLFIGGLALTVYMLVQRQRQKSLK